MKTQIILGLALLATVSLKAQQPGHYLHFNIGGGLNNLSYSLHDGTQKGAFGYTANAAYSYFFTSHFGLQTGVGVQSCQGSSILNASLTTPAVDTDGDSYELSTAYQNWKEKQQTLLVDIPLLAQYRFTVGQNLRLLASAGAQISIPVSTTYKTTAGQIVTTGFYPQWNVELSEMPQHGFGTNASKYDGNYTLKTAYMAVADLGGLVKLSEQKDLYLGAYFNYGLNDMLTPDTKSISEQDGTYNGFFVSTQVKEVLPVAFGVKIGLYLRMGKNKPSPKTPVATAQVVETVAPAVTVNVAPVAVVPSTPEQVQKPATAEQTVVPVDNSVARLQAAQITADSFKFNFALNSSQPLASPKADLHSITEFLAANPDITLYLFGHTCDMGSYKVNVRIGEKRAQVVKKLLIKKGVPAERMKTVSKAYNEPLVPNTSLENRLKNRRVELKYVKETK